MFGFGIPVSQKLQNLLEQNDPPLPQVLEDESCIRAFKSRYTVLIDYLKKRAFKILDIALSDDVNAIKAYQLFSQDNDCLAVEIGDNEELLKEKAEQIFKPETSIVYINRFAFIIQLVVVSKQTLKFDFITHFFNYLHLRAVYGIFEAIFTSSDNQLTELHKEIATGGFLTQLLDYLKSIQDVDTPESEGQICSIYKLIGLMVESQELKPIIKSKDVLEKLLLKFASQSLRVLAEQWAAINLILSEETYDLAEPFVPTLIGYLNIENDKFYPHQVEALRTLAILLPFSELTRNEIQKVDIGTLIYQIAVQFPTYTFAQLAIIQFAKAALPYAEIATPVLEKLFQYTAEVMTKDSALKGARAFVWKLFEEIKAENSEVGTQLIDKIAENAKAELNRMTDLSNKEYGGQVPAPVSFGEDSLGNLSPDQIMALLKFLTGGGASF